MLLVQSVKLTWDKMERGAKFANVRKQFPFAYVLPQTDTYDNVMLHNQYFYQHNTKFINTSHTRKKIYCYSSIEKLHLHNVTICQNQYEYEICYHNYRRGHNKDYHNIQSQYYRKNCINEVAFTLKQYQYGRIIWNERSIDFDGIWNYNIYIYNFYVADKMPQNNIFVSCAPDFVYKQMAMLYRH